MMRAKGADVEGSAKRMKVTRHNPPRAANQGHRCIVDHTVGELKSPAPRLVRRGRGLLPLEKLRGNDDLLLGLELFGQYALLLGHASVTAVDQGTVAQAFGPAIESEAYLLWSGSLSEGYTSVSTQHHDAAVQVPRYDYNVMMHRLSLKAFG